MADPDWIGPPVHEAYWSVDERAAYYSLKRTGSPIVDLHRVEIATAAIKSWARTRWRRRTARRSTIAQAGAPPSCATATCSCATSRAPAV